ncbi:hypothetical protein F5884DRAFT_811225 [Xylogone sp. PMI_703]|nr:hypothetical protein F5884DRAFT_811225 [Xylogone sp. PMI_703]
MASAKLADAAATMVIRTISPSITTLSVPFAFAGGRVKAGGRSSIVRLSTGSLAVFSPVALTPAVREKVDSLGTMRYIVALNIAHHIHISAWAKAFPDANVICVEGLPEKREEDISTQGTTFSHIFTTANKTTLHISDEFDAEFDYEYVSAASNKDLVFLHKPTRTLIEADLLLNLPATEQYSKVPGGTSVGMLGKAVSSAFSAKGNMTWQKRSLWYGVGSKNRQSFGESMRRILGWDFDMIIPCHGDVIDRDAKATFQRLMEWFTHGKKRSVLDNKTVMA